MDKNFSFVYVDQPEWKIIGKGIRDYNAQQAGEDNARTLCFVIKTPDEEIVGGIIGVTFWDWLHVDLMWIADEYRGHGFGQRLLMLVEEEAQRRGVKHVYLDTYSFQAPDFYKKYGYRIFGELQNYPAGHQLFFMTKDL